MTYPDIQRIRMTLETPTVTVEYKTAPCLLRYIRPVGSVSFVLRCLLGTVSARHITAGVESK